MSRRGNCWDNAVAESFFSSLKNERITKRIYKDRDEATKEIGDYIESFYNRTRRHSHLGGVSPEQFEAVNRRGSEESPPNPGNSTRKAAHKVTPTREGRLTSLLLRNSSSPHDSLRCEG